MKIIKSIFYGLCTLIILFGIGILIFAFQPELTQELADFLYGGDNSSLSAASADNNTPSEGNPETQSDTASAAATSYDGASLTSEDIVQMNFVNIPSEVNGKNGYDPIRENNQEVGEEESDALRSVPDYGETGEDLSFDETFYPYYGMLDDSFKALYRQIYANAMALNPSFTPIVNVSVNQVRNVFTAVYNDHPSLFWLDSAFACKYAKDGSCLEVELLFYNLVNQIEEARALFEKCANIILAGTPQNATDFEKELYIHDALIAQVEYDLTADIHQSAYSALVNGQSVCAGYARAFQYLLQKLGIPCYYCTGYAGERHAWNIVRLGDEYYNVDCTWDDTGSGTHDFFNKTDSEFAATHIRQELSIYLPACNGQTYRYTAEEEDTSLIVDTRRSLSDTGITEDAVLTNLEDYFYDCYYHMIENGIGTVTFQNAIPIELWQDIYDAYNQNTYKEGYLTTALMDLKASSCSIYLEGEELKDGKYLITHTIIIQ